MTNSARKSKRPAEDAVVTPVSDKPAAAVTRRSQGRIRKRIRLSDADEALPAVTPDDESDADGTFHTCNAGSVTRDDEYFSCTDSSFTGTAKKTATAWTTATRKTKPVTLDFDDCE
jgi:hypothetical protein